MGVPALLAVAVGLYWAFPWWKTRRRGLIPFDQADAPDIADCLRSLCEEAGVKRHPRFVWNPLNSAVGGVAFGRLGHYRIALSGGLVTLFYSDRPAFEAIVRHELAHLRNGDVDRTYFTVAIWWAFVLVALVPYAVRLIGQDPAVIVQLSWRIVALTALVYLIRNSILRAREVYADVRASVWDGPDGALRRVLDALPAAGHTRWLALLRTHPEPQQRRDILDATHKLFRLGFWDAVTAGIGAALALPLLTAFFGLITVVTSGNVHQLFGMGDNLLLVPLAFGPPTILVAFLSIGAIGVGIWRMSLVALLGRAKAPNPGLAGVGLALGLTLGSILSVFPGLGYFDPGFGLTDSPTEIVSTAALTFFLAWTVLLSASLYILARWIAVGAEAWLEVAVRGPAPHRAFKISLCTVSIASGVWIFILIFTPMATGAFLPLADDMEEVRQVYEISLAFVFLNPFIVIMLMALWALPLAAWFQRRRLSRDMGSDWIYLDGVRRKLSIADREPWRPILALVVGLLSAALFTVVIVTHGIADIPMDPPDSLVESLGEAGGFILPGTILAATLQISSAIVVACWVSRAGVLHGLFAAFVAGLAMVSSILIVLGLRGAPIDSSLVFVFLLIYLYAGGLPSLLFALPAAGIASWIRRIRKR